RMGGDVGDQHTGGGGGDGRVVVVLGVPDPFEPVAFGRLCQFHRTGECLPHFLRASDGGQVQQGEHRRHGVPFERRRRVVRRSTQVLQRRRKAEDSTAPGSPFVLLLDASP